MRWTRVRIVLTLFFALLGMVAGALLGLVDLYFLDQIHPSRDILSTSLGVLIILLGPLGLMRAAYGTCRANPVAPLGVGLGLFFGSQVWTINALRAGWSDPLIAGMVVMGLCFALAGYFGGKRGVRRRFGLPQLGVGIVCAHCGYDLSATPDHAVCPECGGHYRYAAMPPQ